MNVLKLHPTESSNKLPRVIYLPANNIAIWSINTNNTTMIQLHVPIRDIAENMVSVIYVDENPDKIAALIEA